MMTNSIRIGVNCANSFLVDQNDPNFSTPSGVAVSFLIDLVLTVYDEQKSVEFTPFQSPKTMMENCDRWDIGFLGKNDKRAQFVNFTVPLFGIPAYFLGCSNFGFEYDKKNVRIFAQKDTAK